MYRPILSRSLPGIMVAVVEAELEPGARMAEQAAEVLGAGIPQREATEMPIDVDWTHWTRVVLEWNLHPDREASQQRSTE